MARHQFTPDVGPWSRFAPAGLQAQLSFPTPVDTSMRAGRVELVVGTLGAGKTTWAACRAIRLANATGRTIATTGIGWPEPWQQVDSFERLFALRNAVVVLDELHQMIPSQAGFLSKDELRAVVEWCALVRKLGLCVIGTTQAWTKVATVYRNLVTTAWEAKPVRRGRLHKALPFDPDLGRQAFSAQWFNPAFARIPTTAVAWTGRKFSDNLPDFFAKDSEGSEPTTAGQGELARPAVRPAPKPSYPAIAPAGAQFWGAAPTP